MNRIMLCALSLAVALPAVSLLAQGSGSLDYPDNPSAYMVIRLFEGKIAEINPARHIVVVEDNSGKRFEFKIGDKTKFRADKKTELAGRRTLLLSDFETGQPVRVTYLASNSIVTELRLRHVKR